MVKYFIPYVKDTPVAINVKGHKLLLLKTEEEGIEQDLAYLGGDSVKSLELAEDSVQLSSALTNLAESIKAGIVLTPRGVSVATMIKSLEHDLPWVH